MKQINKLMLTSALVVCGFSVANAQVSNKNFIGPSIEVGIQYNKFKNSNIINNGALSFTSADNNIEKLTRVSLNYGFPVAERTVLTLGASFTDGENNFNSSTDQEVGMKYDNMYSLYIAPTYAITDSTAAFAKVSYNKVDASGSSLWAGGSYDSNKKNISGIGIGAGIMTFITKDIFLKAEVERINYGSNTHILQEGADTNNLSLKSVATNTTISIGVKF
jgi:opacity protein-like surface antigen